MKKNLIVGSFILVLFTSCSMSEDLSPKTCSFCLTGKEPYTNNNPTNTASSTTKKTTSVQCSGTTKKGSRCKNKTLSSNGRCHLHGGN